MSPTERENFIRIWQSSVSPREASEKLGISERQATYRAADLRKQGLNLKKFKPWAEVRADLERLNRIAAESLVAEPAPPPPKPKRTKRKKPPTAPREAWRCSHGGVHFADESCSCRAKGVADEAAWRSR